MATITTRAGKGSPLTNTEVDDNFTNLNTDKAELSGATFTGNVGIGASPSFKTDINVNSTLANDTQVALRIKSTTTANMTNYFGVTQLFSVEDSSNVNFNIAQLRAVRDGADDSGAFVFAPYTTGTATERMRIDSSGNVGIGVVSPQDLLHINSDTTDARLLLDGHTDFDAELKFAENGSVKYTVGHDAATDSFRIGTANVDTNPRLVIDSSGNVLVGTTTLDVANQTGSLTGVRLADVGNIQAASQGTAAYFNRLDSDGSITEFRKDGTTVGTIGTETGRLTIGSGDTGLRLLGDTDEITPWNTSTNAGRDALIDLGNANNRFKDIYRSGSTYSTSDRNKKQDIRDLTDAETRVATVAKGSLKAFRYIDSVEAEGDEANIHFGIIAQDLKAAFEAEGLNANDYQVFKTSTYTDDDGVEQTTYSICYENLLAFIIAAI